jgi:hypothetical protein
MRVERKAAAIILVQYICTYHGWKATLPISGSLENWWCCGRYWPAPPFLRVGRPAAMSRAMCGVEKGTAAAGGKMA